MLVSGCGTIVPKQPVSNTPSFSGNDQNSGIIGISEDHRVIITKQKLDQYNSLIKVYGSKFYPTLTENAGVLITILNGGQITQITIDKEHFVDLCLMLDMARKEIH